MDKPMDKDITLDTYDSNNGSDSEFIDVDTYHIPDELANLIPSSLARQYKIIPISSSGEDIVVGIEDPYNFIALEHIERITGLKAVPRPMDIDFINHYIDRLYGSEPIERALDDFHREARLNESHSDWTISPSSSIADAPIVRIVDTLLSQAISQRASDIHIEPTDEFLRIRFRVDGLLQTATTLPLETHHAIITRIKIMGNMDIAEKRLPQDGRYGLSTDGKDIDIRISTIPTVYGEKCLLRLLDRDYFLFPKTELGFTSKNLKKFNRLLELNRGIILICGPTGSGKSTTMYTMLAEMNRDTHNITTIEEPVECKMPGINQIQINEKTGITFANSLRSVLRQDPDIIMVGEIRDTATAEMAIRAAITGHLVISTLHTYDAIGAITRMLEMGIENYFLADALGGIVSQRLIRKVCTNCRDGYTPGPEDLGTIGLSHKKGRVWSRAKGCFKCNYTGYRDRTAVHEILNINGPIRELIASGVSANKIYDHALKEGFIPLREHCIAALDSGITTLDEILRNWQTMD